MTRLLWVVLVLWPHLGAAAPPEADGAKCRCRTPIGSITEFRLPTPNSRPTNIVAGPGGLWFSEPDLGRIALITADGTVTEFPIPDATPFDIAQGTGQDLWLTSPSNDEVLRFVVADGGITAFQTSQGPTYAVNGPGPWFWFLEPDRIGRIDMYSGIVEEFPLPPTYVPVEITSGGSDLWFSVRASGPGGEPVSLIAVMTDTAALTVFPLPTPDVDVRGLSGGPSSDVFWFAEHHGNAIGTITRDGAVREFPLPTPNSGPLEITLGPDGNLWFTEQLGNRIGRITPAGEIAEFRIPTRDARPRDLAQGPDGSMWFTEEGAGKIGRITTSSQDCEEPHPGHHPPKHHCPGP